MNRVILGSVNVIGTDNTLDAAIDAGVKCVICLSTDKAAYPINAMGITKAIEEKIAVAKSRQSGDTKRATIEEFNSDNTYRLNLEETKAKIADLQYIKNELAGIPNLV